ncbi:phosphatase 2C-like domain-containing protein [Lentinula aff. detonsa]|uniref:Phosphatase 2C-like domain-containing protein n=1 Tax=Lentinula aff. detonsa TaxID=2804958 RepID=A0AA38NTC4_9AGAR|nr:phosphatase 2C-like domain-containing protein [Lentinula aff. detonsa]
MPRTGFSESPNARSKSITTADLDTHGILNRHAVKNIWFQVGVSEDKGTRRTMEDAHSFVTDFDSIRGQGFFAIFDGHAGKHAAEWCGNHFHEYLLDSLRSAPAMSVPDLLNKTFHEVDASLSQMCEESDGKIHSGCTAVTAFLRIEDADGHQSFLDLAQSQLLQPESPVSTKPREGEEPASPHESSGESASGDEASKPKKKSISNPIKKALMSLGGGTISGAISPVRKSQSPTISRRDSKELKAVRIPPENSRRVLYCANAGDARGVLCRAGKAVRLTYDHKGSDKQEAKRITDAGGFVMGGRVNGVLAVTRSLGDSSMKDFVVGAPYTTETELCDEDEFLILACDGLWDVIGDQAAVNQIKTMNDAQSASHHLLRYALNNHTTDNVTVVVVRFKNNQQL